MLLLPLDLTLSEAQKLIIRFGLRSPDAIQLATALMILRNEPSVTLVFVVTDTKLKAAATESGLSVLDPEQSQASEGLRAIRA